MIVNFNPGYVITPKFVSKKSANINFGGTNNKEISDSETKETTSISDVSQKHQIQRWSKGRYNFNLYENSIKSDTPLKALDLLEGLSQDEAMEFLSSITECQKTSSAFIDEITRDEDGNINPKKSPQIVKTLVSKLGGKKNFEIWYCKPGGYLEAFNKYTKKLFYEAKSIDELCNWLPNWGAWVLKPKFNQIQKDNGTKVTKITSEGNYKREEYTDGFTLGTLPAVFKDKETFRKLTERLKNSLKTDNGKDLDEIAKEFGFDGAKLLEGGQSGKAVVRLNAKNQEYVIRADIYKGYDVCSDYYNELRDLTPDSLFLDSMVDYYITKHCPDAASRFYFYDDLTGSSIYEFVQGEKASFISDKAQINTRCEDFKETFSELDKIGISFTDFNSNNYVKTKDGIKCIDSGHAVYFDILKPGCGGLTISLPTRTGFNPLEFNGALAQILDK